MMWVERALPGGAQDSANPTEIATSRIVEAESILLLRSCSGRTI